MTDPKGECDPSRAHGRAEPLTSRGPCQLCGRPRCWLPVRHGERRGERCRHNPTPGGSVCVYHGANDDEREAGRRRKAEERVRGAARKALLDLDAEPVSDPIGAALRLAGQLQDMVETLGSRDSLSPEDRALFKSVVGLLGPLLLGLDKSDYKNRRLALEKEQLQWVRVGIGRAIVAAELTVEQRSVLLRVLAAELRATGRLEIEDGSQ